MNVGVCETVRRGKDDAYVDPISYQTGYGPIHEDTEGSFTAETVLSLRARVSGKVCNNSTWL